MTHPNPRVNRNTPDGRGGDESPWGWPSVLSSKESRGDSFREVKTGKPNQRHEIGMVGEYSRGKIEREDCTERSALSSKHEHLLFSFLISNSFKRDPSSSKHHSFYSPSGDHSIERMHYTAMRVRQKPYTKY